MVDAVDTSTEADYDAEARLGRAVRVGLPALTVLSFVVTALAVNLATGILVLVAGTLLGTIALLWASLRLVTGDAPVAPELEALAASGHVVDALASRKTMLVRAIKDLDNEHALGKLEDEDHALIRATYRDELRDVLKQMDDALAPYRGEAEALAHAHLAKVGLAAKGEGDAAADATEAPELSATSPAVEAPARRACAACAVSNEPDARFCKGCGGTLATEASS